MQRESLKESGIVTPQPSIPYSFKGQIMPHASPKSQSIRSSTPEPIVDPHFVTVPEVAKLLRITKQTVVEMIKRGEIAAKRFGRQYRIPHAAVVKLLND